MIKIKLDLHNVKATIKKNLMDGQKLVISLLKRVQEKRRIKKDGNK